jgi:hypothetical protein
MKILKVIYSIRLDFMPVPLSFCTRIDEFQDRRIRTPFATCLHSGFLLVLYFFRAYGRCSFLPKRRLTFKGLQRILFQNIELFITTTSKSNQSDITTDGQPVSLSWFQAQSGTFDQRSFFFSKFTVLSLWGALSDERSGLSFVSP